MTFTDDDLKRLKEDMGNDTDACNVPHGFKLAALLARLEAAEACARYAGDDEPDYLRNPLWVAWRETREKIVGKYQ
jgi:hypothetical protein